MSSGFKALQKDYRRLSCKAIKWEKEFRTDIHKTMHSKKKNSNITYKRMGSELIIVTLVVRSWSYDRVIKTEVQSSVKKKKSKEQAIKNYWEGNREHNRKHCVCLS